MSFPLGRVNERSNDEHRNGKELGYSGELREVGVGGLWNESVELQPPFA